jgi:hypothetical protein
MYLRNKKQHEPENSKAHAAKNGIFCEQFYRKKVMHINVRTLAGTVVRLEVQALDTVANVKQLMQLKEGTPLQQLRLLNFHGKTLDDDRTMFDCNVEENSTISIGKIEIFLKTVIGRTISLVVVQNLDKVEDVKKMVEFRDGIPWEKQRIHAHGRELENGKYLSDYGIMGEQSMLFYVES